MSSNHIAIASCREQSPGEEVANSISSGVCFLAAVVAAPLLIRTAVERGDTVDVAGGGFAATVLLLYLVSTVYHALPRNRAKRIARVLDHVSIYLLIAGTYTPFTLGVLRGTWGWTMFGIVWGLALTGIVLKIAGRLRQPLISTGLYVAMGWVVLIAARPVWAHVPRWGLFWLLAGGVAYSAGVAFYLAKRLPYSHLIWHVFVAAGTTCHFVAVLRYAA